MARFAISLTVLFFLFASTYARAPFNTPENGVIDRDLPDSDNKPTLLLPSEKTEAETAEKYPGKSVIAADVVATTEDLPEAEQVSVPLSRPLTIVEFRPVNRHFQAKRPFPFGVPFRRCRHGIKPMMNPRFHGREVSYGDDMLMAGEGKDSWARGTKPMMNPRFHGREVSYGDDMLMAGEGKDSSVPDTKPMMNPMFHGREVSYGDDMLMAGEGKDASVPGTKPMMNPRFHGREVSYGDDMLMAGEGKDFDPEMFRGGVRQIPARWVRFHHYHHHHDGMPRFDRHHHDMFAKQRFRRPFRREETEEREEEGEGREEREEGGFMSRFRKFLNHF